MKPGKILFLLTITIMILFTNINIVDAKQYTYTFKKSEWTFKQITKYKDLCNATVGSYGGGGTCTFYYKEKTFNSCIDVKGKYVEGCKPISTVNKTAIYDPGNKKTIADGYVKKESDIKSSSSAYQRDWSKMVMTFGTPDSKKSDASAGHLGSAYDVVKNNLDGCGKNEKEPIKSLCEEGSKVTNAQKNAHLKDAIDTNKDKKSEKVSEAEAKKILKGEMKSTNCKELLGDDLVEILQSLVDIVKVAVPILLIALGTLDFGKAIFSSDDNEMKKAQSKFMKRLLAAAAIFLVPSLLGVLLNLGHSIWGDVIKTDLCGIKF